MMKKFLGLVVFLFLFFAEVSASYAITDPLSVPNNNVGIHIFSEKDLPEASKLVNTNGDWGYVTFVITETERDRDRWQKAFDAMRKLHLIPIVRIASVAKGNIWERPKEEEINNWVGFLNSLNWVIENRYVVIGNEPNLDAEWGGKADAVGYALYLKQFSQKLRAASSDFFVLPAGLAPNQNEFKFIRNMINADAEVFSNIDGWASHSYPSQSIKLYKDELKAINKDLPVFITETGWPNNSYNEDAIGKNLISAFENEWNDPSVVAVTPFILDYPQKPFDTFSWKKSDGTFYSFYQTVENFQKTVGAPKQIVKGDIVGAFAQPVVAVGSDYLGAILARNTGQSIWNTGNISIESDFVDFHASTFPFQDIEPTKLGLIMFKGAAPQNTGIYARSLFLQNQNNERVTNSFPVEAYVAKIDKMQIGDFFAKIGAYLKSALRI